MLVGGLREGKGGRTVCCESVSVYKHKLGVKWTNQNVHIQELVY
jgi:hypothetical protein